ncbi:TPA: aminoacyl-tRNA hydrolase [Candidatus Poribacteria bacterium]|nr:aminoacyl-tRNA hydrolase [Candidatus Poribacteria bacterium]
MNSIYHSKLIVGLGNPGRRYQFTRHNVGFEVIDKLIIRLNIKRIVEKHHALVAFGRLSDFDIILAKPLTFVNASGQSVAPIVSEFNLPLTELCVVYDDLNLDLGILRIRRAGSDGGHKGLKSIIHHLDSQDFPRLRVGIGKPADDAISHVLSEFTSEERVVIDESIEKAADALETLITDGIEAAMNKFNMRLNCCPM